MDIFEKPFLDFLAYCAVCEERLKPYKLSSKQIENVFQILDRDRKGYLDVADLYDIDPQISEQELFYIFKWFDSSRSGFLTFEDFSKALLEPNKDDYNDISQSEKCFKNFIRILKATYHSIENKKKEHSIDEVYLRKLSEKVKLATGRPLLELRYIIEHLSKYYPERRADIAKALTSVFDKQTLTTDELVDAFRVTQWNGPQNVAPVVERGKITDKYTTDIDQILKKYENNLSGTSKHEPPFMSFKNNFINEAMQKHQVINSKHQHSSSDAGKADRNQRTQKIYEDAEKILDSEIIKNRSNEIQRRKEELRKGSLERKKIMEDIIGRKYQSKVLTQDHKLNLDRRYHLENTNKNIPKKTTFKKNNEQYQSEVNKSPNSYLDHKYYTPSISPSNNTWQKFFREEQFSKPPSTSPKLDQFYQKSQQNSLPSTIYGSKPNLKNFYKRPNSQSQQYMSIQKENILRRAEQEAARKIEQIERKARMKVMEKKSLSNVNKWYK